MTTSEKFNENPFLAHTPVKPFSNGSEYESWHDNNCAKCKGYECKSKTEDEAGCKLAYHLDLGTITGEVPLWVVKEIGCEYNPLYQYAKLHSRCTKLENNDSFPF